MTRDEMVAIIRREVKGLDSYLTTNNYSDACDDGAREVGIPFPVTGNSQIYWVKQRSIRHLLYQLTMESSLHFKFKSTFINQRFDHLLALIKHMDKVWETELENGGIADDSVDDYDLFGHKVDAGFAYEPQTGRDFTYDEDQEVIVTPNESS